MTVSTTTNKVSYVGNGIATSFAIPFPFLEKEHLKARQLLNDVRTERTDWTVSGGNMVFDTAPANGAQIVIMREVPLTQETDYRENEVLPAETLERCFDKLTMQVQQLKEQAGRAVTVDIFDDTDAADLIPSIRQAVSNASIYAEKADMYMRTTMQKAQEASDSAINASTSAANTTAMSETKANINADNFTEIGADNIEKIVLPDFSRSMDLSSVFLQTGNRTYVAPSNGFFYGKWHVANRVIDVTINGVKYSSGSAAVNESNNVAIYTYLRKGDTLYASSTATDNSRSVWRFVPCGGI